MFRVNIDGRFYIIGGGSPSVQLFNNPSEAGVSDAGRRPNMAEGPQRHTPETEKSLRY